MLIITAKGSGKKEKSDSPLEWSSKKERPRLQLDNSDQTSEEN